MSIAMKQERVFCSRNDVTALRRMCKETRAGAELVERLRFSVKAHLDMSLEDCWNLVPPIDLPRAQCLNEDLIRRTAKPGEESGCPIHGREVFRHGGHYPWILSTEHSWKVQCPVGKEFYPSNDFSEYLAGGRKNRLDTTKQFVDDGSGWVDGKGRRYYFVAYYNHHMRWKEEIIRAAHVLARLYLLTENVDCARKGAVLLLRIAAAYPLADRLAQGVENGAGKILTWHEEYGLTTECVVKAYDDLFEYLGSGNDDDFAEFLRVKGIMDPCRFVEHNFLENLYHTAVMSDMLYANEGYWERIVATIAGGLGKMSEGAVGRKFVDAVVEQARGGGRFAGLHSLFYNNIWHDGLSSSNVSYGTRGVLSMLMACSRLRMAGHKMQDSDSRAALARSTLGCTSLAGMFTPSTGDAGGIKGFRNWSESTGNDLLSAFDVMLDKSQVELLRMLDPSEKTVERDDLVASGTRHFPGYGLVFLESGPESSRRSLSVTYGCTAGSLHHHYDRLNMELAWRDRILLPDMGYPASWIDKSNKWTKATISHYCVEVNGSKQEYRGQGLLRFLADLGSVQVAEVENPGVYGCTEDYRRTCAMIDIDDEHFCVFDVFRVKGGDSHHWSFHGPAARSFEMAGCDEDPSGEQLRVGKSMDGCVPSGTCEGFEYLSNARKLTAEDTFSMEWALEDGEVCVGATVLTKKGMRYHICEAEPELGQCDAKALQYLIGERTGENISSAFAVLVDSRLETSPKGIRNVKKLDAGDDSVVAAEIEHLGGIDVVVSCDRPDRETVIGPLRLKGSFGLVRKHKTGAITLYLAEGKYLAYGTCCVKAPDAPSGNVSAIDVDQNRVAVKCEHLDARPGDVVVFQNGPRRTTYTVRDVQSESGLVWVKLREHLTGLRGRTVFVEGGNTLYTHMITGKYGTGLTRTGKFKPDLAGLYLSIDDGGWSASITEADTCHIDDAISAGKDFVPPDERFIRIGDGLTIPLSLARPGSMFRVLEVAPGSSFRIPRHVVETFGREENMGVINSGLSR